MLHLLRFSLAPAQLLCDAMQNAGWQKGNGSGGRLYFCSPDDQGRAVVVVETVGDRQGLEGAKRSLDEECKKKAKASEHPMLLGMVALIEKESVSAAELYLYNASMPADAQPELKDKFEREDEKNLDASKDFAAWVVTVDRGLAYVNDVRARRAVPVI